jgi:hypothetical protein
VGDSMATGWFYLKSGAPGGQQTGPVTWEQLYGLVRSGAVGPQDLVWNPALPEWLPASQVPGLFAGAGPGGAPGYGQPVASPAYGPQPARSGRPTWLLPVLIPVIALILVGAGLGAFFGFGRGGGGTDGGGGSTVSSQTATTAQSADIGTIEVKLPDESKLIETTAWGEVPANQIGVILAAGKKRADAEQIAQALGGTVVGELEAMSAYQIETAGSTEADLVAALDEAAALGGVELAFPNQQDFSKEEIWGVRQSPLNDPSYSGDYGKGYTLIGAEKAWAYMRGSGLPLSPVQVGIVDFGLYKGTKEFGGAVKITYPDPNAGELAAPDQIHTVAGQHASDPTGGHGTAVAGIIGADPDNGGQVGVASPVLGNKLTISVINKGAGPYGTSPLVTNPDPNDPTQGVWKDGRTYIFGDLAALLKQVQAGAKVINCSFGTETPDPGNSKGAAVYRKFFETMARDHPDVTFVCAAGNESGELTKTNYYPAGAGSGLPNVITVGNVMNDGGEAESSNSAGADGEVTIAAPGQEAIQGVDANGNPINVGGGTSMAAPQVTAAIALLLSLNPKLTPERIKEILVETARQGPEGLGGGILAVDEAVFQVISEMRLAAGLVPALTREQLEGMGVIDAVATSTEKPGVYSVKGILGAVPDGGTQVTITASAGAAVDGDSARSVAAAGEVECSTVTMSGDSATITVTRKDSGSSSVITWKPPAAYAVGDTGPAGGIIFYVKGDNSDGWRYLEAAPASTEWPAAKWGTDGTAIPGARGIAVGTGKQNTAAIIAVQGTGSTYAAQLCDDLTSGGFSDWFLPSKDELALMYTNLRNQGLGDFAATPPSAPYWSSSEVDAKSAWFRVFDDDFYFYGPKSYANVVRAVRAF